MILLLSVLGLAAFEQQSLAGPEPEIHTTKAIEAKMAMRKLWEDHVTYTRNYIISALAGLSDEEAVGRRLLKNQDDIGDAIKPYYGADAGKELSSLLRDHILIAIEVVRAAKAGDNYQLTAEQDKWSGNGKDIAAFLCSINLDQA